MMCSANEVATLAAKAARGAGAPPAQAATFGKAALSHLGAGCAPGDIAAALEALPGGPILDLPLRLARLLEQNTADTAEHVIPPGPFAALELSYCYAQPFAAKGRTVDKDIHLTMFLHQPAQPRPMPRVEIPDELVVFMQSLAAKTLVPDSATSREKGAGGGPTDND